MFTQKIRSVSSGNRGGEHHNFSLDPSFDVPDKSGRDLEFDTAPDIVATAKLALSPKQFAIWKLAFDNPDHSQKKLAAIVGDTKQAFQQKLDRARRNLAVTPQILSLLSGDADPMSPKGR